MRLWMVLLINLSLCGVSIAHDVSGAVEVILKKEKKKKDLSSVIVFMDELGAKRNIEPASVEKEKKNYEIVTKKKQFIPRVLAIPVGSTVSFPNNDPIFHNIFSVAPKFDLGFSKGGETKTYTFTTPGIVKVFCNVHPQMSATIIVSDTTHFTVADKSGNFFLPAVPSGIYNLRAYTDEGLAEQRITVGENPLNVRLTIDGRNFKKVQHKNKFGKEYATDESEKY